ncbi:hypothetical protein NL676_033853 [Syzygium grande]|nr:hypothetical protein NL676_033853 [Syzygium grande]
MMIDIRHKAQGGAREPWPPDGVFCRAFLVPGFTGTACRGCVRTLFSIDSEHPKPCLWNSIASPSPSPRIWVPSGVPPAGYSYFPTYVIPVMSFSASGSSVEGTNGFCDLSNTVKTGQLSAEEVDILQHQNSSDIPKQRKGSVAQIKSQAK